jgi:hypothetical protein
VAAAQDLTVASDRKRAVTFGPSSEPRHSYCPSDGVGLGSVGVGSGGEVGDDEPVADGLTDGDGGGGEVGVGTGGVTHAQVGLAVARGLVAPTGEVRRRGGALVRAAAGVALLAAVVGAGVVVSSSAMAGSGSGGGAARSSSSAPRPPTTAK